MHLSLHTFLFVLEDIYNLADIAARLYQEATLEALRYAHGIWDTMTKAHDRLIKNIRYRNFEKFISVAHKDNGKDFFQEVLPSPFQFLFASTFVEDQSMSMEHSFSSEAISRSIHFSN